MSSHKHGHHHHHQPRPYVEEEYSSEVYEGERMYGAPPPAAYYERERTYAAPPPAAYYDREQGHGHGGHGHNNFQQNERLGELGAVAAGAFALYEGNKAKKDPEHASRHKLEEGASAIGALGSTGYAYYEHREKEKFKDGRW